MLSTARELWIEDIVEVVELQHSWQLRRFAGRDGDGVAYTRISYVNKMENDSWESDGRRYILRRFPISEPWVETPAIA